jgi:hypothetical protein
MSKEYIDSLIPVEINGKWGYIDKNGVIVIPAVYDDVRDFYEGLTMVKVNGKWKIIDINRTELDCDRLTERQTKCVLNAMRARYASHGYYPEKIEK